MKKILLFAFLYLVVACTYGQNAVPGQHSLVTISGDEAWVWLPDDHNTTASGHRYPIVFYFPGLHTNAQNVLGQGVPALINSGWTATQLMPDNTREKFIVVSFTNPVGAYGPGVDFILDSAFIKYKADTTRAYIVGASQGGTDLVSYLLNSSSSYGAPSKEWILKRFKAAITLSMGNPNGQSNYPNLVPFRAKAWHAIGDQQTHYSASVDLINQLNTYNPGNQSQLYLMQGSDHVGYHPQALDTSGTSASTNVWIWLLAPDSTPSATTYNHIGFIKNTNGYSCPTTTQTGSYDSVFSSRDTGEIAIGDTLFQHATGTAVNGGGYYWAFKEGSAAANYRAVKISASGVVEAICIISGSWSKMFFSANTAACGNRGHNGLYAAPDDETLYNGKQLYASDGGSWPANGNYAATPDSGAFVTHTFTISNTIVSNLQVCNNTPPPAIYNHIGFIKNTSDYNCPQSAQTGSYDSVFSLRAAGEIGIGDTLFTSASGGAVSGGSYWWAFKETSSGTNYRAVKISAAGIVENTCVLPGVLVAMHYSAGTASCGSSTQNALFAAPDDETLYNGKRLFGSDGGSWPSNGTFYVSSSNNGTATHSLTLTATVVSNLQACGGQRRAPVPADMPMVNRLYPNPASGTFYVELNELKGNASLRMVNSQGIAVMNISITRSVQPVDISKIKPGLYVVSVIDAGGNEIFNRKLVIR